MHPDPTPPPGPAFALLPMPTHNFSVSPFLLNLSMDITDEDFGAEGEQAEEPFDNVMNRPMVKAFFLMAYILVFVSCVVGNSMVLICIVGNRSMRTVTNFFLANLAIADLLVGIFCVCQNAVHFVLFAHGTWPFGRVTSTATSSGCTQMTRPNYSLLNGNNVVNLQKHSAPAMVMNGRKLSQQLSQNHRVGLNRTGSNCLEIANGGANGLAPLGVRRLPKIELVDSRRRVIRLCAVIVLAFAVLSLPRYIYLTWSVWREANAPRCLNCLSALVQPTTFLLMFFASGINPILYAFLSQRFRAAIRDTFSFRKGREHRKEKMMLLLRNHRLSEQMERDALGYPIARTMSSNGSQNGATSRQKKRRSLSQRPEESILETVLDQSEVPASGDRERSCAF